MKKSIITVAAAMLVASSLWASPVEPRVSFEKYISKQIVQNTSFVDEGYEGTLTIKIKLSSSGIESVAVVSGLESGLDDKIANLIKNTPDIFVAQMLKDNVSELVIPIKLVIMK